MNRAKKSDVVERLSVRLRESPNLYLTDFTGLAVKPITELRRQLRDVGVEYVVVKNTLALRALESAAVGGLEELLNGPTAVVLAGDKPLAAAKVLAAFQKEHAALTLKAGLVEGRRVGPEEIKRLAMLPSREELLGQLAGAMQAPMQGFVGALSGLLYQFAGAVEALRAQRAGT
ncbi:MAG: 50S ribosomal protein L10 [Gemmatimonadota bacterium]|nr:50S ribosomal protein L10 [Gemmatimonadota bacterium]MDH3366849.1 50S ribosomal protein L10 [Gemmatimonadota bacterium]MDH3477218.1 50S ribosomal protein L10 [Gemmatimonadota bacterium]MDH5550344.1 50S ribosomal protein L10 [Gemmatimonadota bacterium]